MVIHHYLINNTYYLVLLAHQDLYERELNNVQTLGLNDSQSFWIKFGVSGDASPFLPAAYKSLSQVWFLRVYRARGF
jgi:hypothetical protein